MKLTQKSLESASTTSSYTRGISYFENGRIFSKEYEDNKIIAEVKGTDLYKVEIEYTGDSYRFSCSCPYDYGGICKHCVAVGLELIQTGRNIYRQSIKWINILKLAPKKFEDEIDAYIEGLLEKYTRRPAFQDEMKKAGFK